MKDTYPISLTSHVLNVVAMKSFITDDIKSYIANNQDLEGIKIILLDDLRWLLESYASQTKDDVFENLASNIKRIEACYWFIDLATFNRECLQGWRWSENNKQSTIAIAKFILREYEALEHELDVSEFMRTVLF